MTEIVVTRGTQIIVLPVSGSSAPLGHILTGIH